jgi:hypothetical protein
MKQSEADKLAYDEKLKQIEQKAKMDKDQVISKKLVSLKKMFIPTLTLDF